MLQFNVEVMEQIDPRMSVVTRTLVQARYVRHTVRTEPQTVLATPALVTVLAGFPLQVPTGAQRG
jgi:hypothetical protein